jgi:[ribosomal protein S5]-alanine N-acetyltransferase
MSYTLLTQRLRLRPLTEADAPFVLELLNDPDFIRQIADRGVRDLPGAREYLRNGALASYAQHGYGMLLVETRADAEPVGICGLVRRPALEHPDLGYALAPAARGCGYASEAGAAVLAHARAVLGLGSVLAIVNPDNLRSIAVLERLGFECRGMLSLPGNDSPLGLYATGGDGGGYTAPR